MFDNGPEETLQHFSQNWYVTLIAWRKPTFFLYIHPSQSTIFLPAYVSETKTFGFHIQFQKNTSTITTSCWISWNTQQKQLQCISIVLNGQEKRSMSLARKMDLTAVSLRAFTCCITLLHFFSAKRDSHYSHLIKVILWMFDMQCLLHFCEIPSFLFWKIGLFDSTWANRLHAVQQQYYRPFQCHLLRTFIQKFRNAYSV